MPASNQNSNFPTYKRLEDLSLMKDTSVKPMYTTHDLAELFGVSARAIQSWASAGRLTPRSLPGRWKYLAQDVEDFLAASSSRSSLRQSNR